MHALNHLHPATPLHLLRYSAARTRQYFQSRAYNTSSSWSPSTASPAHQRNLGDDPPPYSLQPTSAQRHDAMESGAASQQPLKPIDPVTKRYDDMHESYGEGYATRSSEEGFGGIYSSPLSTKEGGEKKGASHSRDDDDVGGSEPVQEFDHTQGSPVAEKERTSRHGGAGFTGAHPS